MNEELVKSLVEITSELVKLTPRVASELNEVLVRANTALDATRSALNLEQVSLAKARQDKEVLDSDIMSLVETRKALQNEVATLNGDIIRLQGYREREVNEYGIRKQKLDLEIQEIASRRLDHLHSQIELENELNRLRKDIKHAKSNTK